jgi:hypothetical protein
VVYLGIVRLIPFTIGCKYIKKWHGWLEGPEKWNDQKDKRGVYCRDIAYCILVDPDRTYCSIARRHGWEGNDESFSGLCEQMNDRVGFLDLHNT